jgi:membrane-associated protease RseP (regulator of RpoE activity)
MITSPKVRAAAVCALMTGALLSVPGLTGNAAAAPTAGLPGGDTFVAMDGEPGDYISQGQQVLYRQPAPATRTRATSSDLRPTRRTRPASRWAFRTTVSSRSMPRPGIN